MNKLVRNKWLFLSVLCFSIITLALCLSSCGGGGGGNPPALPTYSISGAMSGATLAGVTINLTGAATASTTTDTSGNFSFTGLANGTYTVTPVKAGYTFNPLSLVKVVSGANVTGTNFVATANVYVYVTDAIFHQGPPPSASGNSTALVVQSATPSGTLYINSTITWTITWTVTTETVTYVDLYIPEIDGYFEYEVDSEEAAAGQVQFDMNESDTPPPIDTCSRCIGIPPQHPGCWCAQEVPAGTTETTDASVVLIGDGGDVGQPLGGVGITWGSICGNGTCESGENSSNCPSDCGAVCGNGTCESGENSSNCPSDCGPVCGNGTCESGENSSNCPSDCGSSSSCGGSGSTYCSPYFSGCGITVSACCNTGACWYVVNGSSTYCCAGTNCAAAAQTVANIIANACAP